mgnify:CR=1 FL=1
MYKVLIVDDEPWALIGIKGCYPWEKSGFEVIMETTDSEEALEAIKRQKPDLVLTDICMHGLNGIELLKEARLAGIHSEFIIVSGYGEFSYAKEAITYGAFHYLLKPIDKEEVQGVMDRLLLDLQSKRRPDFHPEPVTPFDDKDSFGRLLKYISDNYEKPLYLSDLSRMFHLNETYICDLFKKSLGKTFTEYLTGLRLKKAAELLVKTNTPISGISDTVGYSDYSYFSKIFKKHYGMSPTQYRKMTMTFSVRHLGENPSTLVDNLS